MPSYFCTIPKGRHRGFKLKSRELWPRCKVIKQESLLLVLWVASLIWAVPCQAVDLLQTGRSTLTVSLELKRLEEKVLSARMYIKEMQGRFGPTLGLTASHTHTDQAKPIDVDKKVQDYTVTLSHSIYRPELWYDYQEATLKARLVDIQLKEKRENLLFDTLAAVLDICRIRSRLVITKNSLEFVVKTVDIHKQLLETGYGSRFDLLEAQVEVARYQKDCQGLTTQLHLKLKGLENLSDIRWKQADFPEIMDMELGPLLERDLNESSEWIQTAYRLNSQLMLIQLNQEINQISKTRAYSSLKPNVDLTVAYHQAEEEVLTINRVDDSSIQLRFSMAFSPVSTYYRVRQSDIEGRALEIEVEIERKKLRDSINERCYSIKLKRDDVKVQRQWKLKQKKVVEMLEEGLKEKHFPFSRFIDSSRKYNESRVDLAQTSIDIWEDRVRLLYLSGQLDLNLLGRLSKEFESLFVLEP
jgi:outer membrane protein TolC